MDIWPPNSRSYDPHGKNKSKSQRAVNAQRSLNGFPLVEQGGIGSANLCHDEGRLGWTFLARNIDGRAVSKKDHTVLFPPSRQESFPRPKLGIRQRAEQGAHFLRTYYPDVDVASELIREELEIDARVSSSMETFDPFAGNLLTSFRSHGRTRTKTLYIAFPMGETASDLNISPLQFARNGTATFTPSVSAIRTFNTSIRQLISSTSLEPNPYDGYLAVRTYGLVTLLGINSSTQGVQLQDIVNVARSEAGDRPIMDMAFSKASVVLVVNDRGDVYGARSNDEQIILRHRTATAGNSSVWKLAHTTSEETALLMSASNLSLLDLRTEDTALRISPELEAGETMVFAENMDADYIVRATSTDRLFWMDVRYQQRPLLAIKHGHRSDRTLRTNTVIFNKDPLTFLTSDRHGLVTVYDVSEQGNLLHLNKTPYTFEVDSREYQRYNGRIFVRNPMQPKALMLGLSGRGSLHCTEFELHCGRADDPVATGSVLCERPSVLQDLPKTKEFPSYSESLSSRSLSEADLHSAYLHILTRSTTLESEDAQQTYETLESMGTFWQEVDAPVEHMLTTFDVSFRAGNEPSAASRADFFTGSALNTKRGVRALMQGRLPLDRISEKSAWHINLSAPLSRHVPSMATSPQATMQNLERYNLHSDDYRSGSSVRMELEAREQLTLDLSLAKDVFSPHPLRDVHAHEDIDEALETMSRAAEAMTIGIPEPPPVHFGFLRPLQTRGIDHYARDEKADSLSQCPLGVRLLLQEWEIGTDPKGYTYVDPYDPTAPISPALRKPRTQYAVPSQASTITHRPPAIVAASQPPPMVSRPAVPTVASSQPAPLSASRFNVHEISIASSQQEMADMHAARSQPSDLQASTQASQEMPILSTQVLPGPFGGRPAVAKHKSAKKKRLGGF